MVGWKEGNRQKSKQGSGGNHFNPIKETVSVTRVTRDTVLTACATHRSVFHQYPNEKLILLAVRII